MALVIEDGSGVASANANANEAFVLAYLTDRGRENENGWTAATSAVKQAAIIAATDYIEQKFGLQFKGSKEFKDLDLSKGVLTLTQNPADTETVVIDTVTYTFNTALGGANSILIGANASASLDNLIAAINFTTGIGTTYGTGTVIHPTASAGVFVDDAVVISAKVAGVAGNLIASTTTVTNATWSNATLTGGTDTGKPQPLSFPRSNLFDRDGTNIVGMPIPLKQATAEYAVRSASTTATLQPDPTDTGRVTLKREKVGPIEEETEYTDEGWNQSIVSYPAADRMLIQYIDSSKRVTRA
jgi:hypothetical protein